MNIIKKLIATIYTLFFFCLGAFFINCSVNAPQDLDLVIKYIDTSNIEFLIYLGLAGIFFSMLSIIFIYAGVKREKIKQISFDNPNGEVTISMSAIENFLQKTGKKFEEIKEIAFTITPKRGGIRIKAKTTLWEVENIPQIVENIQNNIKEQFQNILGIENVSDVTVNIVKIVHRDGGAISSASSYLSERQ